MRPLFTDGANSAWHVTFGFIAAVWVWWLIPLFILYQLKDPLEKNILVDLTEFAIGYTLGYMAKKPLSRQRWIRIYS